ncbi:MAG: SDR family NAD(P)-dependent oxidoreductase [Desulfobacteraceae bacterium]|nr:SDR family NAD(P)-dependent oxidoreductase [Desulfobacteraceae bacterium]
MEAKSGLRIFNGAIAIITGGASGIGRAMAEDLARRGAQVVIADLQEELAQSVASGITAAGGKATAMKVDVTDGPALHHLIGKTASQFGRLDYLFNNAGIVINGTIQQLVGEDWDRILNINLRSVVHGVNAALPIMLSQGFGHIVNTGSLSGLLPFPSMIAYATTKHAVVGLSKSLRVEVGFMGVRVSVLCPGFIKTPLLQGGGKFGKSYSQLSPETAERLRAKLNPMPPEQFAQKALDGVAKNKAIIVGRRDWQMAWRLHGLLPVWSMKLMGRVYKRRLIRLGLWSKGNGISR